MVKNITLTSSMRSNLMSLKNIATQMNKTQNILSTGKKVNSAIDNASSYYQARSLTNRANDLNSLLDSMSQGIQTIQAATQGLESATAYLEQMKSVAEQALTMEDNGNSGAAGVQLVDNSAELLNSGEGYIALGGNMTSEEVKNALLNAGEGDKFVLISDVTLDEGIELQTVENVTINGGGHTISCGGMDLGDGGVLENANLIATVGDDSPFCYGLVVWGSGKVKNVNIEYTYTGSSNSLHIAPLSFNENGVIENVNIVAKTPVTSGVLLWKNLDAKNVTLDLQAGCMAGLAGMGTISVDGMSMNEDAVGLSGLGPHAIASGFNIPGFEDKSHVEPFDIMGTSLYVVDIEDVNEAFARAEDSGNGKESSADYIKQYSSIMTQFDELVEDTSYQGVNLLTGGNLEVTFNESRTHELKVKGKDMRSDKIGLKTKEWRTNKDIEKSVQEIINAMNEIRNYSAELGNNYAIIQTRQDFTDALVDVLETGADNLVLADMNEASAEYLMLQTRQQLATNSLSLASQSAQSILSLF